MITVSCRKATTYSCRKLGERLYIYMLLQYLLYFNITDTPWSVRRFGRQCSPLLSKDIDGE